MFRRTRWLQLFGERCSGTNYVEQLLRRNAIGLVPTDRHGWKHGFVHRLEGRLDDTLFILVFRDPFDWARSLWQKPWHAAPPLRGVAFSQFVRTQWQCEWGRDMDLTCDDPQIGSEMLHERDPATGNRFANCMLLRTAKAKHWLSLQAEGRRVVAVRYEDAESDPRAFVRSALRRQGILRWPWFREVRTFKGGSQPFVKREQPAMARADIEWVASQLDAELERALGYDLDARRRQLLAEI